MRLADCVRSSGSGSGATDAPCAEFPMYLKDEMNLKVLGRCLMPCFESKTAAGGTGSAVGSIPQEVGNRITHN